MASIAPNVPLTVTTTVFFLVVLLISINNSKVVDTLGKFLTPFLIVTLLAIVIASFVHPVGTPGAPLDPTYNFAGGFTEGYQTMDALAATMFAGVALSSIVARGYNIREEQLSMTIKAGLIASIGLAIVYIGLTFGGAGSTSAFPADVSRPELLIGMTGRLLGSIGAYCLSLAISLACLTTAVGLAVTCGEYFSELSHGKLSYKLVVIITVVASWIISSLGVTGIINLAVPFLFLLYPVLMALIICNIFDRFIPNKNAYIGAVAGAFLVSIIDALSTVGALGIQAAWIDSLVAFGKTLPLAGFGLGWLIPAIVLAVLFSFLPRRKVDTGVTMEVFDEQA